MTSSIDRDRKSPVEGRGKSTAARSRRYRQRQARTVLRVEVPFDLVDTMVDFGLVPAWDSEEREALPAAAAKILMDWLFSVTRDASDDS